jgi:nicotinamide-nucleotide amidase
MIAEIVSVGNELLDGTKQNTNAIWLADRLLKAGIQIKWITLVGDEEDSIQVAVSQAMGRARIVLVTGGLGPTPDDVTKESLANLFGCRLAENAGIKDHILNLFAQRGIPMPKVNLKQAMVPEGAKILHNKIGTAPGFHFARGDSHCFVMPGVPAEMRRMTEKEVLPILETRFGGNKEAIIYETARTTGIFESSLSEKLSPLEDIIENAELAFLPHLYGVDLRIKVVGSDKNDAKTCLQNAIETISDRISSHIYEIGDRSLEEVVADLLIEKQKTVAVAESCTGGLLANLLTNISGSSAHFLGGVVAYDNSVKTHLLGVKESTLENCGAVSEESAREMAVGVKNLTGADLSVATTGIAGPTGGTGEKPVGLTYVAIASSREIRVKKFIFHRERLINKSRFTYAALNLLRQLLLAESPA